MNKKLLTLLLICSIFIPVFSIPTAGAQEGGLGGRTLVVAHDVNFPPFEYLDGDKYTGFDLDLLNAIAEVGNFKVDLRPMDFNGIIPALQAGQVDMAIAAMTIKPEREEVVDFSIPYFRTGLVLAVAPDNNDIVNPEDLQGKSIATKIGTSGDAYIRELPYADKIHISTYEGNTETYLAVINGINDATINDDSTLRYYIATEGKDKLKVVGDLLTGDDYGIAVPKGNSDVVDVVNAALLTLAENGAYAELYQKWFGVEPSLVPGQFTKNPTLGGRTLVVAHDVNFPPFEYLDGDKYTGFDLDLLNAIAEVGNFKVDLRPMDFNGIIPALQAGQVDMAIAAMTIKPEREEVVDFSIPYFRTGLVLAVAPDNNDIVNPEDLQGKSIATKIGTSGDAYIRELPYADKIHISTYEGNTETYLAVINGINDATINDDSTLRYYIATEGKDKLKVVGDLLTGDDYGIAVPKGNSDVVDVVNAALLTLAENGAYAELYQKWFGVEPSLVPGQY